ncbi:hypothetical protein BGZ73_009202 [Actinomortierella ambigua]|nr:hypothetical protein BGZ73_009202 [Actinomortierella ambigua]
MASREIIQHEVNILAKLHHRHIIQFYRTYRTSDRFFLVTDLAECGSLSDAIARNQLDGAAKRRIANEIARALEYIHGEKIFHCDLKSTNVLLTRYQEAKLCDFGHAIDSTIASSQDKSSKGTLRWLAPEVLSLQPQYSTKSDVYAFGMVMWEMAANRRPFQDHDERMVRFFVKRGKREILENDIDSELRHWIKKCWDQECINRPDANKIILNEPAPVVADNTHDPVFLDFSDPISGTMADSTRDGGQATSDPSQERPPARDIDELTQRAQGNDVTAQVDLATRYEKGEGVGQSDAEALYWYIQAAMQNYAKAQYHVGRFRLSGRGAPQSDSQAYYWFNKAASNEDPEAQVSIGQMYQSGQGLVQSDVEAALYFGLAAAQGNAEAQFRLGWMYQHGRGVSKDFNTALSLYEGASEQGHANALFTLGLIYENGQDVLQNDGRALSHYLAAAAHDHAEAQHVLGILYMSSRLGVERCEKTAARYFHKAADQGFTKSQFNLGVMYLKGRGVRQNWTDAASWLQKAAKSGHSRAQSELGRLYERGCGVEKNNAAAISWYRMAAQQGDAKAQARIEATLKRHRG